MSVLRYQIAFRQFHACQSPRPSEMCAELKAVTDRVLFMIDELPL